MLFNAHLVIQQIDLKRLHTHRRETLGKERCAKSAARNLIPKIPLVFVYAEYQELPGEIDVRQIPFHHFASDHAPYPLGGEVISFGHVNHPSAKSIIYDAFALTSVLDRAISITVDAFAEILSGPAFPPLIRSPDPQHC